MKGFPVIVTWATIQLDIVTAKFKDTKEINDAYLFFFNKNIDNIKAFQAADLL